MVWFHSGEWRNRQTRRIQVPVSERTWGFKSPFAHVRNDRFLELDEPFPLQLEPSKVL